jgi:Ca2+-binding EF-hand superfamily protein
MGVVVCGGKANTIKSKSLTPVELVEEFEIDPGKRGSLRVIRLNSGRLVYSRRDELLVTDTVQDIMSKYFIEPEELNKLWEFFKRVDHTKSGYITLKELYLIINQNPSIAIVGPVLDRFFNLIEKEFKDKVTFEELIPSLVCYVLSSSVQIREFMFNILDANHDTYINRADILKFFSIKKNDKRIYFSNYLDAINHYPHFQRSDKISFEEFLEICHDLHFIYYPAEKLQTLFRTCIVDQGFWTKLHKKVGDRYKQHLYTNNKKMKDKLDEIKLNEKIENYKKNLLEGTHCSVMIYRKEARFNKFRRTLSDTNFYQSKNVCHKEDVNSLDNINLYNLV